MSSEPNPAQRRSQQWLQRRIKKKGLRPRLAASCDRCICWFLAVVVFGDGGAGGGSESFDTVWLAMWWAIQTVSTVGYGDVVPQEPAGKAIASILMVGGLSLLAVVTATVTSAFVARAEADRRATGKDPVMRELAEISSRLDALSAQITKDERGDLIPNRVR